MGPAGFSSICLCGTGNFSSTLVGLKHAGVYFQVMALSQPYNIHFAYLELCSCGVVFCLLSLFTAITSVK